MKLRTAMAGVLMALIGGPAVGGEADLPDRLRGHVEALAGAAAGERHVERPAPLEAAARYVQEQLEGLGYGVERQAYRVGGSGPEVRNLIVERRGTVRPEEIVVVGAHYDTARGTPGANDNASGVAALIELARRTAKLEPARTLRFVAFPNEEPPFFRSPDMGSLVYAKRCHERGERVVAMISLETIGYFSDEPGSQKYPEPLDRAYPDTGNFIGIVGNLKSKVLVQRVIDAFRQASDLPAESAALPDLLPGVGWSDHWAFWQFGYPAVMVTDTAPFRYPHYHKPTDTPDRLDYRRMAKVVEGMTGVVRVLLDPEKDPPTNTQPATRPAR